MRHNDFPRNSGNTNALYINTSAVRGSYGSVSFSARIRVLTGEFRPAPAVKTYHEAPAIEEAARSKAWAFGLSPAGITDSNPARVMAVCPV